MQNEAKTKRNRERRNSISPSLSLSLHLRRNYSSWIHGGEGASIFWLCEPQKNCGLREAGWSKRATRLATHGRAEPKPEPIWRITSGSVSRLPFCLTWLIYALSRISMFLSRFFFVSSSLSVLAFGERWNLESASFEIGLGLRISRASFNRALFTFIECFETRCSNNNYEL